MNGNSRTLCFLALALAALSGCSSKPPTAETKGSAVALQKIQGKAQVLVESGGASDAALNAGGESSMYLWEGSRRYRLYLRTPAEVVHGHEYVAEGVYAQKMIDDIGDPDLGKNGYPLRDSCERVIRTAWKGLPFDEVDARAEVLRAKIKRYPARAVFLVAQIRQATPAEVSAGADAKKGAPEEKNVKEVTVACEKQRGLLVEGATTQTAPLWEPNGGTVRCPVLIDTAGKISDLETGTQLCETVNWAQFRYQPTAQGGRPVKVRTEVEVKFEPRK